MYKYSFENKRLLVPADRFFEWKTTEFGKVPHFINPAHGEVFAFAGIYSTWKTKDKKDDPEVDLLHSFAIITSDPNKFIEDIHVRMPVILTEENEKVWMDEDATEQELLGVLIAYPYEMESHPVSRYVFVYR